MIKAMKLEPKKRLLEIELRGLIQQKIDDFINQTGSHPQDIQINLITFKTDDGHIDVVVDDVEIAVDSVVAFEWRHDLH